MAALFWVLAATTMATAALPWLHAEGTRIVNDRGQPVVLGGLNLGGWLVEEMWMMPFVTRPPAGSGWAPIRDHVTLWRTLRQRLGPAPTARLRTALRQAWLTEADFDRIQALGVNCVRLPFLYDLLDQTDGFRWLDWAIAQASRRGLYVVLDLHGAPGRQSQDHHTGEAGVNRLFKDPAMVTQTAAVWRRLALRYRDQPAVAGYDLLNEPMGAPNDATLYLVMDRLYRAVRSVDSRHLVFVEDGYKGIENMPYPSVVGWSNVVLSIHSYTFSARSEQDHRVRLRALVEKVTRNLEARQAPFYLGEFNLEPHGTPATLTEYISTLEHQGWSWSLWTYKTVMRRGSGPQSMWGLYRAVEPVAAPLNPFTDSAAEFLHKLDQVRTENLEEHRALAAALTHKGVSQ